MRLQCPRCAKQVPAAHISLDIGWGKCAACQELFPLADLVPGFPAPGWHSPDPVQRPFNARAVVSRTGTELLVHLPPEGMRGEAWAVLGFTTFWLSLTTFWTLGGLGLFGTRFGESIDWGVVLFSLPFWFIGLFLISWFAWLVWGAKSIRIDQEEMMTYQHCLVWSRSRVVKLDQVQYAQPYDPPMQRENQPSHVVEIVYRAGSFVLPTKSAEEKRWLIAAINDFLRALQGHTASDSANSRFFSPENRISDGTRVSPIECPQAIPREERVYQGYRTDLDSPPPSEDYS